MVARLELPWLCSFAGCNCGLNAIPSLLSLQVLKPLANARNFLVSLDGSNLSKGVGWRFACGFLQENRPRPAHDLRKLLRALRTSLLVLRGVEPYAKFIA